MTVKGVMPEWRALTGRVAIAEPARRRRPAPRRPFEPNSLPATVVDVVLVVLDEVVVVVVDVTTFLTERFRLTIVTCLRLLTTRRSGRVVLETTDARVLAMAAVDTSLNRTGPTMAIETTATAIITTRRRRPAVTQSPPHAHATLRALRACSDAVAMISRSSAKVEGRQSREPLPASPRIPLAG